MLTVNHAPVALERRRNPSPRGALQHQQLVVDVIADRPISTDELLHALLGIAELPGAIEIVCFSHLDTLAEVHERVLSEAARDHGVELVNRVRIGRKGEKP
jgi:hypothetical protein